MGRDLARDPSCCVMRTVFTGWFCAMRTLSTAQKRGLQLHTQSDWTRRNCRRGMWQLYQGALVDIRDEKSSACRLRSRHLSGLFFCRVRKSSDWLADSSWSQEVVHKRITSRHNQALMRSQEIYLRTQYGNSFKLGSQARISC